jgi:hypothetical protein
MFSKRPCRLAGPWRRAWDRASLATTSLAFFCHNVPFKGGHLPLIPTRSTGEGPEPSLDAKEFPMRRRLTLRRREPQNARSSSLDQN